MNSDDKIFNCYADKLDKKTGAKEITELYLKSFADGKEKGYTPVIVFVNDIFKESIEWHFEDNGSSDEYVKKMLSLDHSNGKELLDKWYSGLKDAYEEEELSVDSEMIDMINSMNCSNQYLTSANTFDGTVYLVHVPTDKPYEIFAWIPFGGFNECPDTEDMISVCKYWYDKYGALPAVITHDTLTFYLDKPVSDMKIAAALAKEHCAFCSEGLGMGGVMSYIDMALRENIWTFWWD